MTIYQIIHEYDVDGGFGDAVSKEEVLIITTNKDLAEQYVEKWHNPVVYDSPYADLYHHALTIREREIVDDFDINVSPWYDYDDDDDTVYIG